MSGGLVTGFLLDSQWHWLRGEMETTKKPALVALGRVLDAANVPYAIIGGVAVQVHHPDPRTTLAIDVAVLSRNAIPREALLGAAFAPTGSYEHSENWVAEDGTPVKFADDPALASAVTAAEEVAIDDVTLRIIRAVDLLHEKIRAGTDSARRRSKRLQDLGDAHALIEAHPRLREALSPEEAAVLDRLPL